MDYAFPDEVRPMSVRELTEKAKEYEWNPRIGFKFWARAAETIHHEGQVYLHEGNLAQAYLVLLRYSILVLEHLGSHPEAKAPDSRKALKPLQRRIPAIIEILETLRPQLDESYDQYLKLIAARQARRDVARESQRISSSPTSRHAANDAALSWNHASQARILDVRDHQDLAVDLAKKELYRRRRHAEGAEGDEYKRRDAGFWEGWNRNALKPDPETRPIDDDDLQRQMEATRRHLDHSDDLRASESQDGALESTPSASYSYPSINKSISFRYVSPSPPSRTEEYSVQPPRPPKEFIDFPENEPLRPRPPPPRPDKDPLAYSSPFEASSPRTEVGPALPPKLSQTTKQERVTFRPAAYLENGEPIRPVFLPSTLRDAFMKVAADNTHKGLEMCGILCGTPVNNALFISCLLIPEQKCTSDTCETENENAIIEYCMSRDLIVIGWIHTHPTQTCFMSSRDLHTQAGYQVMMAESIAIVCAPRHTPSWGIFRLTKPPGLPHILQCTHNDTFHQHSIDNIYTDAGHPGGHVYESSNLDFELHDLRPTKH
ncbi:hypothetical protein B0T26DRAFT_649441 [Lasiosphaeria miniovina]|uniref:MPN domain-containing protein n=1 Tax=Lasiosphaeria miniovina TaxID=1954250 RepID=A0AA40ABH2_9PEZI|nr:uncharacterized protein B0T26DRAFT_649441 [Lasiosphaeria miniovina]KAK0712786.1 hypothetical protein B0T26DRAFT_649441 [Lasiosphaeria miniovina]